MIKLKQKLENDGHTWRTFQCDSEKVLVLGKVKEFLENNNIQLRLSTPYKHAQNGDIERHIGLLYDLTRVLMLTTEAPKYLMEDAMTWACKTLNECRVPRNMDLTPSEVYSGRRPSLMKRLAFFQEGAAHISKEERKGKGKLYPKADIIRFIGHAPNYKDAYLCYNPKNHSVKVRKDVKWFQLKDIEFSNIRVQHGDEHASNAKTNNKNVPKNMKSALEGPDKDQWIAAINKEISSCLDRGTFCKPDLNESIISKPMKSKILLDIKDDGTYKARWVACGYSQQFGIDYDETFSPAAQFKSVLTILQITATQDLELIVIDIGNAFLESTLDKPLYVNPPKDLCDLLDVDETTLKILKGLYGLKQAGKLWYDLLKKLLIDYGFTFTIYDPCVFIYTNDNESIRLCIHVDDILIVGKNLDSMKKLITYLERKLEKVKYKINPVNFTYLGINIKRDRSSNLISLSQQSYAQKIVDSYLPEDSLTSIYPLNMDNIKDGKALDPENNPIYKIMGQLRYLADRTRSDLLYPVNYLSRFMHAPSSALTEEVFRLIRYLKHTINHELVLGGKE